jgi:hypothetical protein
MTRTTLRTRTLLLSAAIAVPLLAAEALSAKTGLWETTTVIDTSGMSMPADAMAKLPPEQRAQMEQMFKQMGARSPNTTKTRACVTAKDLQEGAFRQPPDADSSCKYTPVSSTPKRQEWTFQCTGRNGVSNGRMQVDAVDSTHVRGTIEIKSPRMNMNMKMESTWVSASCPAAEKN